MYIAIKHLHHRTSIHELEKLVQPWLKGFFFQQAANLHALKIIDLTDRKGNIVERHGLLRVSPESAGKRLIKALGKLTLRSRSINASPYAIRHWHNDRRNNLVEATKLSERRRGERRRKGLKMLIVAEKAYPL